MGARYASRNGLGPFIGKGLLASTLKQQSGLIFWTRDEFGGKEGRKFVQAVPPASRIEKQSFDENAVRGR